MNKNPSKTSRQHKPPRAGRERKHARYDLPVLRGITRAKAARKLA